MGECVGEVSMVRVDEVLLLLLFLAVSSDQGVEDRSFTAYPRVKEDNIINYGVVNPLNYKLFGVCVESCPMLEDVVCQDVSRCDLRPFPLFSEWSTLVNRLRRGMSTER